MFARKLFAALVLSAAALTQTACSSGSGGFVEKISLGQTEQNGVKYFEVKTTLKTAGLFLSAITIPIMDPQRPAQLIGQVSIVGGLGGGPADLTILLRSDVLPSLPKTGMATLPNGTMIPIAGLDANNWISLRMGSQSRLYLNLDSANSKVVLGAALGVDGLSTGVIGNVLLPFSNNNVNGIAGLYSGARAGQSGFAIFIDASQWLNKPSLGVSTFAAKAASVETKSIEFVEQASSKDSFRAQRRILQLQQGRYRLDVR